jgi:hypothetical protein
MGVPPCLSNNQKNHKYGVANYSAEENTWTKEGASGKRTEKNA